MSATDPTYSPDTDPQWLQWQRWQQSPQFHLQRARMRRRNKGIFFLIYGASSGVLSAQAFSMGHGATAGVFFAVTTVLGLWLAIHNLRTPRQSR